MHCTATHLTPDWGRRSLVIGTLPLFFFRPLAFLLPLVTATAVVVLMLPARLHRLLLVMVLNIGIEKGECASERTIERTNLIN